MRGDFNRGRGGGGGGNFRGRGGFRGRNNFRDGSRGRDDDVNGFKMSRGRGRGDFQMRRGDGKDRRSFSPRGGFNRGGGRGGFNDRRGGFRGGFKDGRGRGGNFRGGFEDRRGGFNNNKKFFGDDSNVKSNDDDDDDNENNFGENDSDSGSGTEMVSRKQGKPKKTQVGGDESDDQEEMEFDDDDDSDEPKQQGKRKAGPNQANMLSKKLKSDSKNAKIQASDDDSEDDDESQEGDDDDDDDDDEEDDSDSGDQHSKAKNAARNGKAKQGEVKSLKSPFEAQGKQKKQTQQDGDDSSLAKKVKELAKDAQAARNQQQKDTSSSHRLFVGQLPLMCTKEHLEMLSPDIKGVFLPNFNHKRKTKFAFLEFESAEKMNENLKRLQSVKVCNQSVIVNVAEKKPDAQQQKEKQQQQQQLKQQQQQQQKQQQQTPQKGTNLKTVYVSGLPKGVTLIDVVAFFPRAIRASIEHQKRSAIITFNQESEAAAAVKANKGISINGTPVSVDFSQFAAEQTNLNKSMSPMKETATKPSATFMATPKETKDGKGAMKSTPGDVNKSKDQNKAAKARSLKDSVLKSKFVSKDDDEDSDDDGEDFDDDDSDDGDDAQPNKAEVKNKILLSFSRDSDDDDDEEDDDSEDDSDNKPNVTSKQPGVKKPVNSTKNGDGDDDDDEEEEEDDDDDDDDDE